MGQEWKRHMQKAVDAWVWTHVIVLKSNCDLPCPSLLIYHCRLDSCPSWISPNFMLLSEFLVSLLGSKSLLRYRLSKSCCYWLHINGSCTICSWIDVLRFFFFDNGWIIWNLILTLFVCACAHIFSFNTMQTETKKMKNFHTKFNIVRYW